jgi:hypothetical protein
MIAAHCGLAKMLLNVSKEDIQRERKKQRSIPAEKP